MAINSQDLELTLAMRKVLDFAKRLMPDSHLCILSFTHAEDEPGMSLNKIATNAEDRMVLREEAILILNNFAGAEVLDLRDVQGGMQ